MNSLTNFVCEMMVEQYESMMCDKCYSERKELYEALVSGGIDEFETEVNTLLFETCYDVSGQFKEAIIDSINYMEAYRELMRVMYEDHIMNQNTDSDTETEGSTDCE
jgi:hypothetical protein